MKSQIFYLYGIQPWLENIKLPLLAALLVSGLICAAIAFLIGWPVLRLKSDYLAIATLGFSEIIRALFGWDGLGTVTNASYGVSNIPSFSSLYECVIICVLCIIIMALLINSSYGRAFKAVRDDDVAAEAMGINLLRQNKPLRDFFCLCRHCRRIACCIYAFCRHSTFTAVIDLQHTPDGYPRRNRFYLRLHSGAFLVTGSQSGCVSLTESTLGALFNAFQYLHRRIQRTIS